jgi:L-serine kinase (ATP) / ParB family transcriptional regulator, heme-responsive regulator
MSAPALDPRLPDLRFVPVESLIPHERHDDQRMQPLVKRLREDGMMRNPPIVAPLGADDDPDAKFVILDGANRVTAATAAGLPHVVVQVVRYGDPGLELSTWYHALMGFPHDELGLKLARIPGLECHPETLAHARAVLARREAIAYVVCGDGSVDTLHGSGDLRERNDMLNAVVDSYRGDARFIRVASDSLHAAQARHPDVTALIVFPRFEPEEVIELALSGARLPAGITRHLVTWRALRINTPLDRLADKSQSTALKNKWLREWMQEKLAQRRIRFYQESTVAFDE